MIMCATVIFVRIEQGAVKTAMKNAAHVKENTVNLKKKNTDLQEIQKQLQADEDEYVCINCPLTVALLFLPYVYPLLYKADSVHPRVLSVRP